MKLDGQNADGELWYRCDECGAEQEEDSKCKECGCHGIVPFLKPYPPEPKRDAHATLRAKLDAALEQRGLEGQLDSMIELMRNLTDEEKVIFLEAMRSGLLAVGISVSAAIRSMQGFCEELRRSQVSMKRAMENWRKAMQGLSGAE